MFYYGTKPKHTVPNRKRLYRTTVSLCVFLQLPLHLIYTRIPVPFPHTWGHSNKRHLNTNFFPFNPRLPPNPQKYNDKPFIWPFFYCVCDLKLLPCSLWNLCYIYIHIHFFMILFFGVFLSLFLHFLVNFGYFLSLFFFYILGFFLLIFCHLWCFCCSFWSLGPDIFCWFRQI